MTALIEIRELSKRFGATQALSAVDMEVRGGEVLALLGQNGAGKSTIIKILAGVYSADSGSVTVGGHALGSVEAQRKMAFIHQDLGLVSELTIAENVALGTGFPMSGRRISWRGVREQAVAALEKVGFDASPDTLVADLTRTERSLVAIGRAIVVDAEVLVLDEPTASLPVNETERLFAVIGDLRARGLGLVYVSHRLDEVFQIADRMVVLRDGKLVGEGMVADQTPADVVTMIVGRQTRALEPPPLNIDEGRPAALVLEDVVGERVGPVSLEVRAGEVVGLVGLAGAGMGELGRGIAGALPLHSGRLIVEGREHAPSGLIDAVGTGICFITSNRLEEGLGPNLSVAENLLPNPLIRDSTMFSLIVHGRERKLAAELVDTFGIEPRDPDLPVTSLSGGNQQKVVIGRWLSTDSRVLILEEPTAGVDVGAKADLYALLDDALGRGVGVLMVSTDVEEVANVCHRALVFRDGLVVEKLDREQLTVQRLVAASSGVHGDVA